MSRRVPKRFDMEVRYERARRRNMSSAKSGLHNCILVLDGLKPDFNIGKIFRTADAFGVREIYLIGVHAFDPDPAKGSVRWVKYQVFEQFIECFQVLQNKGYTVITLEPGCSDLLGRVEFPAKTAFVFGHEEFGLSFDRQDFPDIASLSIPQWGHVQSLNVSVAASIVSYEYIRQHGKPLDQGLPQKGASVNTRYRCKANE